MVLAASSASISSACSSSSSSTSSAAVVLAFAFAIGRPLPLRGEGTGCCRGEDVGGTACSGIRFVGRLAGDDDGTSEARWTRAVRFVAGDSCDGRCCGAAVDGWSGDSSSWSSTCLFSFPPPEAGVVVDEAWDSPGSREDRVARVVRAPAVDLRARGDDDGIMPLVVTSSAADSRIIARDGEDSSSAASLSGPVWPAVAAEASCLDLAASFENTPPPPAAFGFAVFAAAVEAADTVAIAVAVASGSDALRRIPNTASTEEDKSTSVIVASSGDSSSSLPERFAARRRIGGEDAGGGGEDE